MSMSILIQELVLCDIYILHTTGKNLLFRKTTTVDGFCWCVLQADFCDVCKDIVEYLQTYADSNATEVSHM